MLQLFQSGSFELVKWNLKCLYRWLGSLFSIKWWPGSQSEWSDWPDMILHAIVSGWTSRWVGTQIFNCRGNVVCECFLCRSYYAMELIQTLSYLSTMVFFYLTIPMTRFTWGYLAQVNWVQAILGFLKRQSLSKMSTLTTTDNLHFLCCCTWD